MSLNRILGKTPWEADWGPTRIALAILCSVPLWQQNGPMALMSPNLCPALLVLGAFWVCEPCFTATNFLWRLCQALLKGLSVPASPSSQMDNDGGLDYLPSGSQPSQCCDPCTVPHVVVTPPTIKIFELLLHNCNFAIVANCNINIRVFMESQVTLRRVV